MFFFKNDKSESNEDKEWVDELLSKDEFYSLRTNLKDIDLEIKCGHIFEITYRGPKYKKPTVENDGGEILISEPDLKNREIKRWEKGFFKLEIDFSSKSEIVVTIPERTKLDELEIISKNGDVKFDKLNVEDANVEITSGDFSARSLRSEDIEATVTSGDVILNQARIGRGDFSLTSGDFKLKTGRVVENLTVETVSGDNVVSNTQVDQCELSAMSGDNFLFGKKVASGLVGMEDGSILKLSTISGDNRIE